MIDGHSVVESALRQQSRIWIALAPVKLSDLSCLAAGYRSLYRSSRGLMRSYFSTEVAWKEPLQFLLRLLATAGRRSHASRKFGLLLQMGGSNQCSVFFLA